MLVSPAEPPEFKTLGKSSVIPERYGADFLMYSPHLGRVGVQRKEIKDLIASLSDDRLAREIPQLQSLDIGIVVIEGRLEWTVDDNLFLNTYSSPLTKAQYLGILWSLCLNGLWTGFTDSKTETLKWLSWLSKWMMKSRHTALKSRTSAPKNVFGTKESRDWQIHVMQGFPGVGYGKAEAIVDHFGGLPLRWSGDLTTVPGVGGVLSRRLGSLLDPSE